MLRDKKVVGVFVCVFRAPLHSVYVITATIDDVVSSKFIKQ
jgi:hypothetical protein